MPKKLPVPGAEKTTAEIVAQDDRLQVQIVEVGGGGSIPRHSHDVSAAFIVLSGKGTFTGGRKTRDIAAGDVVHIPAGQKHGWTNKGRSTLRFVSVSSEDGIYKNQEKKFHLDYA
jgi:quercetin dioxygenase-like cupin family protein